MFQVHSDVTSTIKHNLSFGHFHEFANGKNNNNNQKKNGETE